MGQTLVTTTHWLRELQSMATYHSCPMRRPLETPHSASHSFHSGDTLLPFQQSHLLDFISLVQSAGATIINNTELPYHSKIVPPYGWDWNYGSIRGYPNESEYTVVKVDFYNDIAKYLAELNNTDIRSLKDIVNITSKMWVLKADFRMSILLSSLDKMASWLLWLQKLS